MTRLAWDSAQAHVGARVAASAVLVVLAPGRLRGSRSSGVAARDPTAGDAGRRGGAASSRSPARRPRPSPTSAQLVASRQPRNAVGWIFLGVASARRLSLLGGEYGTTSLVADPGPRCRAAIFAAWLYVWTWFPPCRADRARAACSSRTGACRGRAGGGAAGWFGLDRVHRRARECARARARRASRRCPTTRSASRALDRRPLDAAETSSRSLSPVVLVASLAASIVRFRRSRGDERQQLKWMTYGASV